MTEPGSAPNRSDATSRPRTYLQSVIAGTVSHPTATIGLIWLGLLASLAVFAPFIANSHPYIMVTTAGEWSFPLFTHLGPTDVTLVVLFLVAVGLCFTSRVKASRRLLVLLSTAVVVGGLSWLLVTPPVLAEVEQYREMQKAGEIRWMLRAPVPYSATDRQRDQGEMRYKAPLTQGDHLMGTEGNGADVLSRLIHASRIAIAIGFIATGLAFSIGVIIGGLMGYFSGIVDLLGMRLVEVFSAIPTLILLLTLAAVIPPEMNSYRIYIMMVIIGLTGWVGYARFTRAEFLRLRQQDFVHAAVAVGVPLRGVLFRHMLPNGLAPLLVESTFGVASAILAEATLSFLGLGLVDDPSWGQMLSEALASEGFMWWMAVFPGLAIFFTVFAFTMVGEALRDAIDPYTSRQG